MAMNLSAASPIAGAGRPRFAARAMKVGRSISRLSSWPSNSASFTPFEADAVSNMVVLLAVGARLLPTRVIDRWTLDHLSAMTHTPGFLPMTTNEDPPGRRALSVAFERIGTLDLTRPLTGF